MTDQTTFQPGVHFDMPEDQYHSIPALSASGMKWLSISAEDYWARTPWLNPSAEIEETYFMELGRAYHTRILDGADKFQARYCPALDRKDYEDYADSLDELKQLAGHYGLKTSGTKAALRDRIREADPGAPLWHDMLAAYSEETGGRVQLPFETIARIETAAAMIEKHSTISKCFTGGAPEVSIFWRDAETDVPLKARLDYLKIGAVSDLKSFSNPQGRSIDRAIYSAIEYRKYYIQAAQYLEAAAQLSELLSKGLVFDCPDYKWLERCAARPKEFVFVFQQSGIAPLTRARRLPDSMVLGIGKQACRAAIEKYKLCVDTFGNDPWIEADELSDLDDAGFSSFIGA